MPTIAIIGSTGRNAMAWTEAFLAAGFGIRSLVRNPGARQPQPGVTPVPFDLDDPATHAPALAATDVLALVTPAEPRQTGRELALVEAARRAGVGRILNLSVTGAELPAPITPFARWQVPVEAALRASGIPHVTLRPNGYMQNMMQQREGIAAGRYVEPTGNAATSLIDIRDIAAVAVAVADGSHDGEALTLTGPEAVTGAGIAEILTEVTGQPVAFASPPVAAFCTALLDRGLPGWRVDGLAELYQAIADGRAGHLARVSPTVERITGRPPHSLRDFVRGAFGAG